jgi:3-keto-disaccharide hydrolase
MNVPVRIPVHVAWLAGFLGLTLMTPDLLRAELVVRKVNHGTVYGYKDTPLLPSTNGRYHVHDPDRPVPKYVAPGQPSTEAMLNTHPSDAILLFDGGSLQLWQPTSWKVKDGLLEAGEGDLETKEAFGDFQLHLEWMAPTTPPDHKMSRGNSGVMIMGLYEIQIFDSWHEHPEHIYPDGQAASIYGQTPPMVNVCRGPGEWQSFDILFTAPIFRDGKLLKQAVITMLHNGAVVHLNQPILGPAGHREIIEYQAHPSKLPLALQGHHSPVRFRNIWIRSLE